MAFPCNQFGKQEPKPEAEIKTFVESKFNVKFPMFAKIDVNGAKTHPIYTFLKGCFPGDLTWNFSSKFLVDRNGIPVARFEKESWADVESAIVEKLKEKPSDDKTSGASDEKSKSSA
jgi:glutathione peroxidase-family protein